MWTAISSSRPRWMAWREMSAERNLDVLAVRRVEGRRDRLGELAFQERDIVPGPRVLGGVREHEDRALPCPAVRSGIVADRVPATPAPQDRTGGGDVVVDKTRPGFQPLHPGHRVPRS